MIFVIKETFIILAIATNISQRLKTGFVLQAHIFDPSGFYSSYTDIVRI